MLKKIFVVLLFSLVLASCRQVPELSVVNKAKKIGFISLMRNTFTGVYVGTTAFTNKVFTKDMTSWGIPSMAENVIMRNAGKNRNFSFRKAQYNKSKLQKIYVEGSGAFSSHEAYLKELKVIALQQGFDTLLVLEPIRLQYIGVNSPHSGDFGIYHRYSALGKDHLCVYYKYKLVMYNMRSGEKVAAVGSTNLRSGGNDKAAHCRHWARGGGERSSLPQGFYLNENFTAHTEQQKSIMKTKTKNLLKLALERDLECLKLKRLRNGKYREEGCSVYDSVN